MPTPETPVYARYGAPMGRRSSPPAPGPDPLKVSLRRVRVSSAGYDPGGAYWGRGASLWYACSETGPLFEIYFRARDRAAARAHVLALKPGARFFR